MADKARNLKIMEQLSFLRGVIATMENLLEGDLRDLPLMVKEQKLVGLAITAHTVISHIKGELTITDLDSPKSKQKEIPKTLIEMSTKLAN